MNLFRRKSVADLQTEARIDQSLKRALGPLNLTTLGIGAVIGAGIFVLTGQAAAKYAGPAIVFSFILAGVACAFAGLCNAEFSAMLPISGSAYTYGYATLGEFFAWIIGWDLILEYLFAASTVAVGWSGYVVSLLYDLKIPLPPALSGAYGTHLIEIPTALAAAVKFRACWTAIHTDQFGWDGIKRAAGVIFFAYIGFDAVSTAAQEAKKPQRDMPIGILASLAICTVIYIAVSLVLTGIVSYTQLNVPAPIAVAVDSLGPSVSRWMGPVIKIGAIAGLSSVILVMMLGQPRIFYTMSKDGLLPPVFSAVHPKFRTPWL